MTKKNVHQQAPRIYNIFPRLVGKVSTWDVHAKRALDMGFNWIYINPINYSGFSGSSYSIKDHFRMNPTFAEDEADEHSWGSLKTFITKCHAYGMKFMMDLVINHTAIDAVDTEGTGQYFKESWYKKKFALIEKETENIIRFFDDDEDPYINEFPPDEFELIPRIASPFAVDPQDSRKITIWGDLAELNYDSPMRNDILAYWKRLIDFYIMLGVDGFRCDAAYMISPEIWEILINYANQQGKFLFFAETLGCTLKEVIDISAHFDYIASSVKYWDFTQNWAIDQYNESRIYAPSISFPESHDTPRLAADSGGREDYQIFKYLFSAIFTAGTLIPIGYEYGFEKKLDVVNMTPEDWELPQFDITSELKQINELKAHYNIINEDGKIDQIPYADLGILLLKKSSIDQQQHLLLIYNKDWQNTHHVEIKDLRSYLDLDEDVFILSINGDRTVYAETSISRDLSPNEYLLLYQKSKKCGC